MKNNIMLNFARRVRFFCQQNEPNLSQKTTLLAFGLCLYLVHIISHMNLTLNIMGLKKRFVSEEFKASNTSINCQI